MIQLHLHRLKLILLLCLSLSSETVSANPKPIPGLLTPPLQLRTQTNTSDTNRAAAEKAEQEAGQLGKQKAPLLTKIIPKWEEALKYWRLAGDRQKETQTLDRISKLYLARGEFPKALEYAQKALPICQALGDRDCEGAVTGSLSLSYQNMGEYEKAIDMQLQLPFFFPKTADLPPAVFSSVGQIYDNLGEKQKALDYYNKALDFWKEKGDVVKQAERLQNIAFFHVFLGEIEKSIEIIKQANNLDPEFKRNESNYNAFYVSLRSTSCSDKLASIKKPPKIEKLDNSSNQSASTNSAAATKNNIESWKQKVQQYRTQELLRGEAGFLELLGGLEYKRIGEYKKALEVYQQALELRQIMGGKPREAETLTNIADILNRQGKKQEAINVLNQALDIQRQIKARPAQADTLLTLGDVYLSLGAYPESLNVYNQALSTSKIIGNRSREIDALRRIGDVYRKSQTYPQALSYYQQALSISKNTGNCNQESTLLSSITQNHFAAGDYQQAINFGNQALALSRNLEIDEYKLALEARTLDIFAKVEIKQGNYSKSLESSQKARKLGRESGFREIEARAIAATAEAYEALKQPEKAIQAYQEQLALYAQMGLSTEQAQSYYNIAKLQRQNNQLPESLSEIDKAIEIIENIRKEVVSEDLKTSFFATVQDYYQLKINILMELHKKDPSKGYNALALDTSERSRARSLLELLTEAHADIRKGVDPKLLEEELSVQQQIDARRKIRIELLSSKKNSEQVDELNKEIEELSEKYQQILASIRAKSPVYAAITQPHPLTLAEIQSSVLDDNTILLQYSLGKDHSYLWLVTKTGMKSYELPKGEDIETAAKKFYQNIKGGRELYSRGGITVQPGINAGNPEKVATKLSQMLLQPVAQELGNKRLLIVGDGILQYIPFAALPNPTQTKLQPLLVEHEIVNAPSASTISVVRNETKNRNVAVKKLAVLADPVFSKDDDRLKPDVTQSVQNRGKNPNFTELNTLAMRRSSCDSNFSFPRLEGTHTEATNILSLVPKSLSKSAFDFDVNRTTVTNPEMSQYQIVHFATHGFFDTNNPKCSSVVLSLVDSKGNAEDGFLQLQDIFNLNLPAELVVLSACETGLGEQVKGEGLVGLTRGFMYAGSPRVAVSLWSVDDQGTAELMTKFYTNMLKDNLPSVAALRAAQLEMWQSPNPNYSQTNVWAAFTLQGEWR
ncbi:CHAT domain-containing tetratricopeptide repeat protein [Nostoc punctiforme]|uniref:Tetratricopeptide TPR_2 repeat protein n=1 Tax=Nostoc punctiforme (strain ATCC 29133 / PCC 73102) TaxID=63737 RepID=B2JAM9_NOSP7|nr:CHAT domain-containing protein [Nostoc punctiforme]ACC84983.1 Tetratricopeptide TPR_2 repeat protein [Nostoc punctiforme PCC 73102]